MDGSEEIISKVREDKDGNIMNRTLIGNESGFKYSMIRQEEKIRRDLEDAEK